MIKATLFIGKVCAYHSSFLTLVPCRTDDLLPSLPIITLWCKH